MSIEVDVLIIGSGPAGMSTALHLLQQDPTWANRIVVVDKATHPREKLCGGGITSLGADILAHLGLGFETPHISVREARLVYQDLVYALRDDPVFRVVRRDEFDQWLVQQGEQRGVMVRQGEGVRQITPGPEWVEVVTEQATFRAKVVVAADGSRSFVRQKLFGPQQPPPTKRMARLLEILTPERATERAAFREGVAVFDFTPMGEGLQGYYWDFPSLVKGQFFMNRGVFDSRARTERPRILLKELFQQLLLRRKRKLADYPLKGHPIYWFNRRGQFARPRVILAGDAAGVDPLLGEGISFALAYGQVAAAAINEAFIRQDFSFTTYKEKILIHNILSQLVLRARLARVAYKFRQSWLIRLGWRLFPLAIQLLVWTHRTAVLVKSPRTVRLKNADSQD